MSPSRNELQFYADVSALAQESKRIADAFERVAEMLERRGAAIDELVESRDAWRVEAMRQHDRADEAERA